MSDAYPELNSRAAAVSEALSDLDPAQKYYVLGRVGLKEFMKEHPIEGVVSNTDGRSFVIDTEGSMSEITDASEGDGTDIVAGSI
jgi:hypothetical protein